MKYYCDNYRHLVCIPYSIENLHIMAKELGIKKCWYHSKGKLEHPHYDIPKKKLDEIKLKCEVVTRFDIVRIIKMEF